MIRPLPLTVTIVTALALSAFSAPEPARVAIWVAALLLGVWTSALRLAGNDAVSIDFEPRKQHWLQACAQGSVYLYWGAYWPEVRQQIPLILAQVLFAYGVGLLLAWSRREKYSLGFGPFPIVFSINLFLWFRPEWFALQLAMVALGLAAKEFIRWQRDGRRVHIFNPSSFPLAVASIALLATSATGITWGPQIATTQFYPPHMFLMLFLIGLPGQLLFGVTTMTMPAVLSAYLFSHFYFESTGIYYFYDSHIPIAVFLGMHLLFTDPSTSPRTVLGRILYGSLYGLGTVLFFQLLGQAGLPTFYDKLLPVPLLNLAVQGLDRVGAAWPARWSLVETGMRRNFAYVAVWAIVFAGISSTGAFSDDHPGQYIPFWQQACDESRAYACPYLADLEQLSCDRGSGWACNEAGLMHIALYRSGEDARRAKLADAAIPFRQGCDLGFDAACRNLEIIRTGEGSFAVAPPNIADWPILLRGSKGEIRERDPSVLLALACTQGWTATCNAP